ncbi:hypothetical protein [Flavicella sp.]|uniref:hypothetical protein n=1 Tax=Flavicella sp. TaxID=2957742 RepID=UPI002605F687|nr:hypothetical protein [Flavicella sp.]MDG1804369.1 hypothetical protein [Flavicella sp.]
MKKILILKSLLFAFILAASCDNAYELPYNDYSSFSLFTSGTWDETYKVLNIDQYVIYKDLSSNAMEHTWTIPASCKFLNKEFTEFDSIYSDFIILNAGTVTTEAQANVLFTEPGIQEIKLHNVYKDSVVGSVLTGGQWVLDTVFKVDVFANVNPACYVYTVDRLTDPSSDPILTKILTMTEDQNPQEKEMGTWDRVTIEAGSELYFEDQTTTGRPTGGRWYTPGASPEQSGSNPAFIKYNKLGEFTSSMESIRGGDGVPSNTVGKLIPLVINVIGSSQPFVQSGKPTVEEEDGVQYISFAVTGEVETLISEEDNFTVHVVNTDAGFDGNIAVESARINSEDATVIELVLADEVYNTDVIDVSFAGGNIVSVDARILANFSAVPVKMNGGNNVLVQTWASFETFKDNWKSANCTGYWVGNKNGSAGAPIWTYSDEKASDGLASMKYTRTSEVVKMQGSDFSKPSGLAAGKYIVSMDVYLETGNTMKNFLTVLATPSTVYTWDIETLPRGEWVTISQEITIPDVASGVKLNFDMGTAENAGAVDGEVLFLDNQSWIVLNPRP